MKKIIVVTFLVLCNLILHGQVAPATHDVYNFKEISIDGKDKSIIPIGKKRLKLLDIGESDKRGISYKKNSFKLPDINEDINKKSDTIDNIGKLRNSYFNIMGATHGRYVLELKDTFNSRYSDSLHYVLYGKRIKGDGYRINDNFSHTSVGFEVGNTLEDNSEVTGTFEFLRAIDHLPGPLSNISPNAKNDDRIYSFGGQFTKNLDTYNSFEINADYKGHERKLNNPSINDKWDYDRDFYNFSIQYNRYIKENSLLSFGYNIKYDSITNSNLLSGSEIDSVDTTVNNLYVKRDINLGDNSMLILQLEYIYESDLDGFVLPKIDFKYIFTDKLRLDLHYGKEYNNRDFSNLYLDKKYVPINSNLGYKKEDYIMSMAGFDYQFEPGYKAFFKIYTKNFSNYHYYDETYTSDRFNLAYTNGKVDLFGINTGAKFKFSPNFRCEFKYNFLLTDYANKDLPNIPKNQLNINMEYDVTDKILLKLDEKIVGEYYSDISNTKTVSSIVLANAEVKFNVNEYIKPYLGIENLFNKQYSIRYDHNGEGRVYYAGVKFKY